MKIRHILIATDLSETSRRAYPYAAALARLDNARVTLIHVNEASLYAQHTAAELLEYLEQIGHAAADALANEADYFATEFGVAVDVVDETGRASDRILDFAAHNEVDAIVVAKHGARIDRRILMGSTSQRVVARSTLPVLVVDAEVDAPSDLVFKKLGCTTDWTPESHAGIEATVDIATRANAHVTVMHALPLPIFVPVIPGEPPLVFPREILESQREHKEEQLKALIAEHGGDNIDYRLLMGGAVGETLVDVAGDYDLVIMPSHGKGAFERFFIGSTTLDVVRLSTTPIMILPPAWLAARLDEDKDK